MSPTRANKTRLLIIGGYPISCFGERTTRCLRYKLRISCNKWRSQRNNRSQRWILVTSHFEFQLHIGNDEGQWARLSSLSDLKHNLSLFLSYWTISYSSPKKVPSSHQDQSHLKGKQVYYIDDCVELIRLVVPHFRLSFFKPSRITLPWYPIAVHSFLSRFKAGSCGLTGCLPGDSRSFFLFLLHIATFIHFQYINIMNGDKVWLFWCGPSGQIF